MDANEMCVEWSNKHEITNSIWSISRQISRSSRENARKVHQKSQWVLWLFAPSNHVLSSNKNNSQLYLFDCRCRLCHGWRDCEDAILRHFCNHQLLTQVTKIVNCRSRQQQLHRRMFLQGLVLAWKRYIDRFLREMRQHFSQ